FYLAVNVIDGLNGFLPPSFTARFDLGLFGALYHLLADVITVLILVGMVFFLVRRFLVKPRSMTHNARTLLREDVAAGAITSESLISACLCLLHVGSRLAAESFLLAANGHTDPCQPFASTLAGLSGCGEGRMLGWHGGWWGALGLILAFLPYFPRSKHLHLFT